MKRLGILAGLITLAIVMFAGMAQAATVFSSNPIACNLLLSAGMFTLVVGMALAADAMRIYELGEINEFGMAASATVYEGSAVGDNGSGYARALTSGDKFLGFAESQKIDTTGAAGGTRVRVKSRGKIQLAVGSAAITDVGRPVYATDDNTFVLTGIGSYIGHVYRYVSSGVAIVEFDAGKEEEIVDIEIPVVLAKLSAADVLTTLTPGFSGRIKSFDFAVTDPVTTGSKAGTVNLEIGTTDLTGGVISLTSSAATPLGKIIAGTAITAGAAFTKSDTVSIEASSVTTFIEGQGVFRIKCGK